MVFIMKLQYLLFFLETRTLLQKKQNQNKKQSNFNILKRKYKHKIYSFYFVITNKFRKKKKTLRQINNAKMYVFKYKSMNYCETLIYILSDIHGG